MASNPLETRGELSRQEDATYYDPLFLREIQASKSLILADSRVYTLEPTAKEKIDFSGNLARYLLKYKVAPYKHQVVAIINSMSGQRDFGEQTGILYIPSDETLSKILLLYKDTQRTT